MSRCAHWWPGQPAALPLYLRHCHPKKNCRHQLHRGLEHTHLQTRCARRALRQLQLMRRGVNFSLSLSHTQKVHLTCHVKMRSLAAWATRSSSSIPQTVPSKEKLRASAASRPRAHTSSDKMRSARAASTAADEAGSQSQSLSLSLCHTQ